jgi:hypothetical protein
LAALELLHANRRREALHVGGHEPAERLLVEPMLFLHRHRAGIVFTPP